MATFYLPKFLLVGLVWLAAITLSSWQEYNELHDPTYNYRLDTGNFLVCFTYHSTQLTNNAGLKGRVEYVGWSNA